MAIFLVFILLIAGESLLFSRILRFPVHVSPLVSILLDTLILYVFGVNNALSAGYRIVLLFSILLSIVGILYPRNYKLANLLPLPLVTFILISVGLFFYTRGALLYEYDEFAHWGLVYRYMMTAQSIPVSLNNVSVTYPPFAALWQYFTSSFLGFDEANAYFGHMMVLYAAILALFPIKSWKSWYKYFPALIGAILSVFVLNYTFQSLYVDLYLGLLLAAGLAQIDLSGDYPASSSITVGLAACALTLVKSTGFLLALILVMIYAICLIYSRVMNSASPKQFAGSFVVVFLILIAPAIAQNSWSKVSEPLALDHLTFEWMGNPTAHDESFPTDIAAYMQALQRGDDNVRFLKNVLLQPMDTTITLTGVFESFTINAPYRTKLIAANYIDTFSNSAIRDGLATQKWVVIGTLVLVLINIELLRRNSKLTRIQNLLMNALLLAGFISYAIALYLAYIYLFSPVEGLTVPSLNRYLGSFTLAWWLVNLAVTFTLADSPIKEYGNQIALWVITGISIGFLLFVPTNKYIHIPYRPIDARFDAEERYSLLKKINFQPDDKVYDLWPRVPQGFIYRHIVMRYLLTPVGSNFGQSYLEHYDPVGGSYIQDLSPEQWMNLLIYQKYTYVLIDRSDGQFWDTYGGLFDYRPADGERTYLFKVTQDGLQHIPLQ